jgi:hypothetical protein
MGSQSQPQRRSDVAHLLNEPVVIAGNGGEAVVRVKACCLVVYRIDDDEPCGDGVARSDGARERIPEQLATELLPMESSMQRQAREEDRGD